MPAPRFTPTHIGPLLVAAGYTQAELGAACDPPICQNAISRIACGHVAPTMWTAWRIVQGLRALTGEDYAFETVFPAPRVRRAAIERRAA